MPLVYCPVCDSAVEKAGRNDAEETSEKHNEGRHGGDEIARVFRTGVVHPEEVNEMYNLLKDWSREHRQRFAKRVIEDDRFRIRTDEEDEDDEVRKWTRRA